MKKIRVSTIRESKAQGRKIVCVTAHDAITAAWAEAAGADLILAGDSLGMTALGFPTTIKVTLEMMIHHAAAVARGAGLPLLVGDMPFMSYKASEELSILNCARMIREGGMEAVKIEGGQEVAGLIRALTHAGLPVMAHIGLLPQSVHAQGGYRVQGKTHDDAERLIDDARAVEAAGAFSVVLEGMAGGIAERVSGEIAIPTIGIGAGAGCDGQILVVSDLLGMGTGKPAKFVKQYANLHEASVKAIKAYAEDVREGKFPGAENSY